MYQTPTQFPNSIITDITVTISNYVSCCETMRKVNMVKINIYFFIYSINSYKNNNASAQILLAWIKSECEYIKNQ